MKRTHIHVGVADLDAAIHRYTALFGAAPALVKDDYAKWMLDDPALNFAISTREGAPGHISHLGLQLESVEALESLTSELRGADAPVQSDREAHCCYARSDKEWTEDADGIAWELFVTHDQDEAFGDDSGPLGAKAEACCD